MCGLIAVTGQITFHSKYLKAEYVIVNWTVPENCQKLYPDPGIWFVSFVQVLEWSLIQFFLQLTNTLPNNLQKWFGSQCKVRPVPSIQPLCGQTALRDRGGEFALLSCTSKLYFGPVPQPLFLWLRNVVNRVLLASTEQPQ